MIEIYGLDTLRAQGIIENRDQVNTTVESLFLKLTGIGKFDEEQYPINQCLGYPRGYNFRPKLKEKKHPIPALTFHFSLITIQI
jgi:hypothetical protein